MKKDRLSYKKYWIDAQGNRILISEMTDSHLINTIKLLERYAQQYVSCLSYPNFSGEMAQECAENAYDELQGNPLRYLENTVYDSLVQETLKRTLDMFV